MNAHDRPETYRDAFDGAAISKADREHLASLGNHPLAQHPLYSVPPPSLPDYDALPTDDKRDEAKKACFVAAIDWLLVNYAYCRSAFGGKGGVVSLVDGETIAIGSLEKFMLPYALEGRENGRRITISPAAEWMKQPRRQHIDGIQTRFDQRRPTFEEDGLVFYNRYWPPTHPAGGGETETFKRYFAQMFPDEEERTWTWHWLSYKTRRPWTPLPAVIMVAEEFGTGRGTFYEILELLFGKDYVLPCEFGELTGRSQSARFNDRLARALIVYINEADDEDGHQQARRRLTYEGYKNAVELSPTARRRFEQKFHYAYEQRSARSTLVATQHPDLLKLPRKDRRTGVLTGGDMMSFAQREEIRAWMVRGENIGALYRAFLETPAVPSDVFDPFGRPPPFAGRLRMIGMGETRLEDAYGAAIEALEGHPLFTMTQVLRLIGYFGDYRTGGDWADKARYAVVKNAYRLRERDEPNNRIMYRKKHEIIYARTKSEQRKWQPAGTAMLVKQLDLAEAIIASCIGGSQTDAGLGLGLGLGLRGEKA